MDYLQISGPVAISKTVYKDNTYFFFSDLHGDDKGKCKCNNCKTVSELLDYLFKKYENVDFYLEYPFLPIVKNNPFHRTVDDSIADVWNNFSNCIHNTGCIYKNIRFHTIDIRQGVNYQPLTIIGYVFGLYKTIVKIFKKMIKENAVIPDRRISDVLTLLSLFQQENILEKSFFIYLLSDNYVNDMTAVFSPVFDRIESSPKIINKCKSILFEPKYVVYRNEKVMSRVRAQIVNNVTDINNFITDKFYFKSKNISWKNIQYLRSYYFYYISKDFEKKDVNEILGFLDKHLVEKSFIPVEALLMDAYTLGRMFKYNVEKSIVYAGVAHVQMYLDFFENRLGCRIDTDNQDLLFWKRKYQVDLPFGGKNVSRCIKVPLFWF